VPCHRTTVVVVNIIIKILFILIIAYVTARIRFEVIKTFANGILTIVVRFWFVRRNGRAISEMARKTISRTNGIRRNKNARKFWATIKNSPCARYTRTIYTTVSAARARPRVRSTIGFIYFPRRIVVSSCPPTGLCPPDDIPLRIRDGLTNNNPASNTAGTRRKYNPDFLEIARGISAGSERISCNIVYTRASFPTIISENI